MFRTWPVRAQNELAAVLITLPLLRTGIRGIASTDKHLIPQSSLIAMHQLLILSSGTRTHLSQRRHQLLDLRGGEQTVWPLRGDVRIGRFVEQLHLHHTVFGQVFDDEIHKLDLVCRQRFP